MMIDHALFSYAFKGEPPETLNGSSQLFNFQCLDQKQNILKRIPSLVGYRIDCNIDEHETWMNLNQEMALKTCGEGHGRVMTCHGGASWVQVPDRTQWSSRTKICRTLQPLCRCGAGFSRFLHSPEITLRLIFLHGRLFLFGATSYLWSTFSWR